MNHDQGYYKDVVKQDLFNSTEFGKRVCQQNVQFENVEIQHNIDRTVKLYLQNGFTKSRVA
jgi:hypothetical protein